MKMCAFIDYSRSITCSRPTTCWSKFPNLNDFIYASCENHRVLTEKSESISYEEALIYEILNQ